MWFFFSSVLGRANLLHPPTLVKNRAATGELTSEPSAEPASGGVRPTYPKDDEACSETAHLFRSCPKRLCQTSLAWKDSAVWAAPRRHRKVGTLGLPDHASPFPAFRWRERYVRSRPRNIATK